MDFFILEFQTHEHGPCSLQLYQKLAGAPQNHLETLSHPKTLSQMPQSPNSPHGKRGRVRKALGEAISAPTLSRRAGVPVIMGTRFGG